MKTLIQKIKNWYKIRKCKSENHLRHNYSVISKTIITPWEEPRNGKQLRTVSVKKKCLGCGTVYLRNNEWEFRDSSEQFSAD